jgi:hypothetical protein
MMYRFPNAPKNHFATEPDAGCRVTRVCVPTMNKARGVAFLPGQARYCVFRVSFCGFPGSF